MKNGSKILLSCASSAALLLATLMAANAADAGTGTSFKGPIGLQLYSLRDQLGRDVPGTLAKVHQFGIKYVELAGTYKLEPAEFKKLLDTNGLDAVSAHFSYERFLSDPQGIATEAKALGLRYAGCAWIPHTAELDELTCRQAIMAFNRASILLARQGVKFFYHIHGYEFQKYDSGTMLDLMMKDSNPATVHFEMDVFWVVHAGQDPVKLLEKYGNRWELLHLKDMKKSAETGLLTGHSDVTNDVALGAGKINLAPILAAAQKIGVKYYFLEDESPSSEQQIPLSLKYLEKVAW